MCVDSLSTDDTAAMDTDTSMEVGGAEGVVEVSCMPERAALIKSILNFLKKAVPEPTFAENIRNCTSFSSFHIPNFYRLTLFTHLL